MLLAPSQYVLEQRNLVGSFLAKVIFEVFLEQLFGCHLGDYTFSGGGTSQLIVVHEHKVAAGTFEDINLEAMNSLFTEVLDGLQAVFRIARDSLTGTMGGDNGLIREIHLVGNLILGEGNLSGGTMLTAYG